MEIKYMYKRAEIALFISNWKLQAAYTEPHLDYLECYKDNRIITKIPLKPSDLTF